MRHRRRADQAPHRARLSGRIANHPGSGGLCRRDDAGWTAGSRRISVESDCAQRRQPGVHGAAGPRIGRGCARRPRRWRGRRSARGPDGMDGARARSGRDGCHCRRAVRVAPTDAAGTTCVNERDTARPNRAVASARAAHRRACPRPACRIPAPRPNSTYHASMARRR